MLKPRLRPAARTDVTSAVDFLAPRNRPAAQRFVERLNEALEQIRQFPRIGTERTFGAPLGTVRWWPLSGFPYLIFYRVEAANIDVLRVLHGARDIPKVLFEELHPASRPLARED